MGHKKAVIGVSTAVPLLIMKMTLDGATSIEFVLVDLGYKVADLG